MFASPTTGQVASSPEHGVSCPEVPLAETRCAGSLLAVQPHGHNSGVCAERGAPRCREDEEVSPQAGDRRIIAAMFRSGRPFGWQAARSHCVLVKVSDWCFPFAAGEGRGEAGRNRHYAEIGVQKLPAAFRSVRYALWLAAGHPRRDQHWVSGQKSSWV